MIGVPDTIQEKTFAAMKGDAVAMGTLLAEITSCNNISVLEGINSNTAQHPDRCAPSSVLVLFRQNNRVGSVHIFDSPRKQE